MSESAPPTTSHQVIDHLAAIKLHANALDRRLRLDEQLDLVNAKTHLDAISLEVDAAVELVRMLTALEADEPPRSCGALTG